MSRHSFNESYTWGEFVARCALPAEGKGGSRLGSRSSDNANCGGTFNQAMERATGKGYAEVLPEVERVAGRVSDQVFTSRLESTFQAVHDVAGSEVDIDRFLDGTPECMIESEPVRIARQGRAVRVAVNVSASWCTDEAVIRRRGAAVLALLDVLRRAQHPVEVWAVVQVRAQKSDGAVGVTSVLVQRADEPVDEGRLAFALAHPGFLRRLWFACEEQHPGGIRQAYSFGHTGGGYGIPVPKCREDCVPPDATGHTILVDGLGVGNIKWTEEQGAEWINDQLDTLFGADS